ncbi:MAG: pseudouridine synthase [Nannocystaceae bacterium]
MSTVILLNKPFQVLCRFTDPSGRATLADFVDVPSVYAAGRLDYDSEGLVVLTDDGALQHRISDPRHKLAKVYWVQVEREPSDAAIAALEAGVELRGQRTAPAQVRRIAPPDVWVRDPPIRVRAAIPTAWLEIVLREGRNRQVRRMTAAVGHPTLRLIRRSVGPWNLGDLQPGEWRHAESQALTAGPGRRRVRRRSGRPGASRRRSEERR